MDDTLYQQPMFYRMLFDTRHQDLEFYRQLAQEVTGSVLEIGVGTGRVALELARSGYSVVGVDTSEAMLAELARQVEREALLRERLQWHLCDAQELSLQQRFPLVIMPFNGFAHFHRRKEQSQLFHRVKEHLKGDGRFAFDVLLPDPGLMRGESASSSYIPWFRDPRTGLASRYDERVRYDAYEQILTIETTVRSLESESEPEVLTLRLRLFFPQEIRILLEYFGFEILNESRDIGDVVLWVCRPR